MPMEQTLTWIIQLIASQSLALLTAAFEAASLLGLGAGRVATTSEIAGEQRLDRPDAWECPLLSHRAVRIGVRPFLRWGSAFQITDALLMTALASVWLLVVSATVA